MDRAVVAIGKEVRTFIANMINDVKAARARMAAATSESRYSLRSVMGRVRETARDYAIEFVQRLRARTWTSCLVHYVQMMPERLATLSGDRVDVEAVRMRLQNVRSAILNMLSNIRERMMEENSRARNTLRDMISNIEFTSNSGEMELKVRLPHKRGRSLRLAGSISRRIEGVRELLERGVAAVKARLANPNLAQMTVQRVAALMQYFRIGHLRMMLM